MSTDSIGRVADEALLRGMLPRPYWSATAKVAAAALPRARRYVLSSDASEKLGKIIAETDDLILQHHQFALAPYPYLYAEIDARALHRGIGRPTRGTVETSDTRVAYLSVPDRVIVFAAGPHGSPGPSALHYLRSGTHPFRARTVKRRGTAEESDWAELAFMLGSSMHNMPSEEVRQSMLNTWSCDTTFGSDSTSEERFVDRALGSAGDLRTFLALMLLLNNPAHVIATPHKPRRGIYRGRNVVYAAHHVLEIELGRAPTYRQMMQHHTDRATPRGHEVPGHFYHWPGWARDRCTRPEGHDWPLLPSIAPKSKREAPTWTCRVCDSKRTWKATFARGDASRGWVTKEYEVT